jgi:hypothetical protein
MCYKPQNVLCYFQPYGSMLKWRLYSLIWGLDPRVYLQCGSGLGYRLQVLHDRRNRFLWRWLRDYHTSVSDCLGSYGIPMGHPGKQITWRSSSTTKSSSINNIQTIPRMNCLSHWCGDESLNPYSRLFDSKNGRISYSEISRRLPQSLRGKILVGYLVYVTTTSFQIISNSSIIPAFDDLI